MEVEEGSHHSAGVVSQFLHLFLEISVVVSWEALQCLGERGNFADEDKHILGQVVDQSWSCALIWVLSAHVHEVKGWALELALDHVLHDLSTIGEQVHVLLDIGDVGEDGEWVGQESSVEVEVVKCFLVEALVGLLNLS